MSSSYWSGRSPAEIEAAALARFRRAKNEGLSTRSAVRFGRKGSITVQLTGSKAGAWYDHESGEGGYLERPTKASLPRHPERSRTPRKPANGHITGGSAETDARQAEEQARQEERLHLKAQFEQAVAVAGTPAAYYLVERRRLPPPWPDSLRYAASFRSRPDAPARSVLLAAVTDDRGELVAVHAIEIDPATRDKAKVDTPKKSHGPVSAGEVKLGRPDAPVLVVGEGLETVLSRAVVGQADLRACCGKLRFIAPAKHHRRVEILADQDKVTEARALAQRYARQGLEAYVVETLAALGAKADLNDLLRLHGMEGVQAVVAKAPLYKAHARQHRQLEIGSDFDVAVRVIEDMELLYGPILYDEGAFWRYDGTRWEKLSEAALVCTIQSWDGAEYPIGSSGDTGKVRLNRNRIQSIIYNMTVQRAHPGAFAQGTRGLACDSGFVRLLAGGEVLVEPHERTHHSRHIIPGRYPAADVEGRMAGSLLMRLLTGCFKGDPDLEQKIVLLQEIAGAVVFGLGTKLKKPKAILLVGERAENGKSQWLDVLQGLVPPEAVCSIAPAKLGDERFLPGLAGKLLNIAGELSVAAIASDIFKEVITGDRVAGREAYARVCEFNPIAQHVFASNVLPPFRNGVDAGVMRRLLPLGFNRIIPLEERVIDIGKRIAEEERDLLLDFAVEGAQRLAVNGVFTEPASSVALLKRWAVSVDPVRGWLSERIVLDEDSPEMPTAALYHDFKTWGEAAGIPPPQIPAHNGFVQRLLAAEPRILHQHKHTGGVTLNVRFRRKADLP